MLSWLPPVSTLIWECAPAFHRLGVIDACRGMVVGHVAGYGRCWWARTLAAESASPEAKAHRAAVTASLQRRCLLPSLIASATSADHAAAAASLPGVFSITECSRLFFAPSSAACGGICLSYHPSYKTFARKNIFRQFAMVCCSLFIPLWWTAKSTVARRGQCE